MSENQGYILNTVQTPGPLRTVFESIRRGHTTSEKLRDDTDLPADLLKQGLNGLQQLGMIGREEPDYYTIEYMWETDNRELDFRMTALNQLAKRAESDDWGKQSVVLLNYQYLLQHDIQYFESNDKVLFNKINDWQQSHRGYRPRSSQGPIVLNGPKFVNWTRLADSLGLIYKMSGRSHTVYPGLDMIEHSIRFAIEDVGDDDRISIEDYFDWLNQNFLLIELTSDGSVPAPFARVLYTLVRNGAIRIVEHGDAGAISLDRIPGHSDIDREANTLEVVG